MWCGRRESDEKRGSSEKRIVGAAEIVTREQRFSFHRGKEAHAYLESLSKYERCDFLVSQSPRDGRECEGRFICCRLRAPKARIGAS